MNRDIMHRIRVGGAAAAALIAAVGGAVIAPMSNDASATGTYTTPFQAGPKGGDSHNIVVSENPSTGKVTVVRANPLVGAFNCAGQGGFADLRVVTAAPLTTNSVTVKWAGQSAINAYTWITLLIRDGNMNWLGGVQRRGPLAGAGSLATNLAATVPAGSQLNVQFGIQVASACPDIDGGTVQFSSVTLSGGTVAAARSHPIVAAAQPAEATTRHVPSLPRAHAASTLTAVAFTFIPGDDDTSWNPVRIVQGSNLFFANADPLAPHTVTSVDNAADGSPLFTSGAPTQGGATSAVVGTSSLAPGVYEFYCRVHTQMRGILRVVAVAVRGRIESW